MILAVLQARTSSSRLPGKVLAPVLGRPMLSRQVERIHRVRRIDHLLIATSDRPDDQAVEELCHDIGVDCYRGSLDDVLDRFYSAAAQYRPDAVVRLTGDCPLADPEVIDGLIEFFLQGGYDYASNTLEPTWPDGLDAEIMRFQCLEYAWREAGRAFDREHVTPFINRDPQRFRLGSYRQAIDLSNLRWTVDEPQDLEFVRTVYARLYPHDEAFTTADILALLDRQPELRRINEGFERNANCRDPENAAAREI